MLYVKLRSKELDWKPVKKAEDRIKNLKNKTNGNIQRKERRKKRDTVNRSNICVIGVPLEVKQNEAEKLLES